MKTLLKGILGSLRCSAPLTALAVAGHSALALSVGITSPANFSTYTEPASIYITATNSPDTVMARLIEGTAWRSQDDSPPFSFYYDSTMAGVYSFSIWGFDATNNWVMSLPVQVLVSSQNTNAYQGVKGEYYGTTNHTGLLLTRNDDQINFDWGLYGGTTVPAPTVANTNFSVRWTGEIVPQYSELYTFYIFGSDGVRLWVSNQLVIDDWNAKWPAGAHGTISLLAGHRYPIKVEHYSGVGNGSICQLSWSSASQWKQIVPKQALYITSNSPPVLTLLSPTNGTVITASAPLMLSAVASDSDGFVTKVEFYLDGAKVGGSLLSSIPYTDERPHRLSYHLREGNGRFRRHGGLCPGFLDCLASADRGYSGGCRRSLPEHRGTRSVQNRSQRQFGRSINRRILHSRQCGQRG